MDLVVIHVEAGSEIGTISWFANPEAHVSAHYSISKAGQVYQHVQERDIAWHAGLPSPYRWNVIAKNKWPNRNPNEYSIGIEHEGQATEPWPEAQIAASAALVARICMNYKIPIDRAHVVGHVEIYAGHSCPGVGCPLNILVARAAAIAPPV